MSELATDFHRIMREEARLTILKALGEQVNESLNSSILQQVLASFAITMERAWVHQQIDYLETMGAVTVVPAGSVKIATLTETGRRHLDRHCHIEGVKRPSRPGS